MLVVAFYMRALTVISAVGAASPPVPRVLIASPPLAIRHHDVASGPFDSQMVF